MQRLYIDCYMSLIIDELKTVVHIIIVFDMKLYENKTNFMQKISSN